MPKIRMLAHTRVYRPDEGYEVSKGMHFMARDQREADLLVRRQRASIAPVEHIITPPAPPAPPARPEPPVFADDPAAASEAATDESAATDSPAAMPRRRRRYLTRALLAED